MNNALDSFLATAQRIVYATLATLGPRPRRDLAECAAAWVQPYTVWQDG